MVHDVVSKRVDMDTLGESVRYLLLFKFEGTMGLVEREFSSFLSLLCGCCCVFGHGGK